MERLSVTFTEGFTSVLVLKTIKPAQLEHEKNGEQPMQSGSFEQPLSFFSIRHCFPLLSKCVSSQQGFAARKITYIDNIKLSHFTLQI